MTSHELRQRAQTHRAIHANRVFALAGTSEGAAKGWETRKDGSPDMGGGGGDARPRRRRRPDYAGPGVQTTTVVKAAPRPMPTPAPVRKALTGVIGAMAPGEKAALAQGWRAARAEGYAGNPDDFLAEQAALYEHAEEGDPRFKTWLSGDTLDRLKADPGTKAHLDTVVARQKTPSAPITDQPATPAPSPEPAPPAPPAEPQRTTMAVAPAAGTKRGRQPSAADMNKALALFKQVQARRKKKLSDAFILDGTSEGAELGWESRKDGDHGSSSSGSSAKPKIVKAIKVKPVVVQAIKVKPVVASAIKKPEHKETIHMTSDDLRARAEVHRTIYLNRTMALAGTSEGAAKGWETRKGGGWSGGKDDGEKKSGRSTGKTTLTPAHARSAGTDAANRSMRKAGRTSWNEDDYATAAAEYNRLMPETTDKFNYGEAPKPDKKFDYGEAPKPSAKGWENLDLPTKNLPDAKAIDWSKSASHKSKLPIGTKIAITRNGKDKGHTATLRKAGEHNESDRWAVHDKKGHEVYETGWRDVLESKK